MACPWGPTGGGMYRVVDYLMSAQQPEPGSARLEGLDTRGQGSALSSLKVLARALRTVWQGHRQGDLAGVHIHLAERMSLLRKGTVLLLCRALRLPVILHLHAAQFEPFYRALPTFARWLTRKVLAVAPLIIVLGPQSRRFLIDEVHLAPERIRIVPNGVPGPADAAPEGQAASNKGAAHRHSAQRHLLFVGNLSGRKGVGDLLQALSLLGWDRVRTRITLAGGGDVEGYRRQARTLGLEDAIEWTGWVDRAQVRALMASADTLVLPSYDEGLPLVILEALAQGLPVVCTPVGEIAHFLRNEEHALFVQPGDPVALASTLQRALGDASLRQRLSQAGRQLHAREFSIERFADRIAGLHREIFGCCTRPRKISAGGNAGLQ